MNYWGGWTGRKVRALCEDGVLRVAVATNEPDTYFSVPARVQAKGKTVRGYITSAEDQDGNQYYRFIAYTYRKNHKVVGG